LVNEHAEVILLEQRLTKLVRVARTWETNLESLAL